MNPDVPSLGLRTDDSSSEPSDELSAVERLKQSYRWTARLGWVLLTSLFAYAVLAVLIKATHDPSEGLGTGEGAGILKNVFLVLALSTVAVIVIMRHRVLGDSAAFSAQVEQDSSPPSLGYLLGRLRFVSLLTFVLAHSIAVYGLMLFLYAGRSNDFFIFFGLSLLCFLIFFPRYSQWHEWVQKRMGDPL